MFLSSSIFNFLTIKPSNTFGQECVMACPNLISNPNFDINTTNPFNLRQAIFNGFVDDWAVALNIPHLIYIRQDGSCFWGGYDPATENEDLQTCLSSRWDPNLIVERGYAESIYQQYSFISDPFITYEICIDAKNLDCGSIEDQSHLRIRAINDIFVGSLIFHETVPPVLPGVDFENIGDDVVTSFDFDTYSYTFQPNSDFSNLEIINAVEVEAITFLSIENINVNCVNSGLTGFDIDAMDQIVHFTMLYEALDINIVEYNWNFGDGGTSTDASPTHMYDDYDSYVVCLNIVDEYGCCASVCQDIEILPPPISCPIDENSLFIDAENPMSNSFSDLVNMGLYSSGGTMTGMDIVIKGSFTLDVNFTFDDCNFYFEPGSELKIESLGQISIKNSELSGCSKMWKGITVKGVISTNPFLYKTAVYMNENIIRDAYAGIEILDDVDMYLGKTLFENNYMGIYSPPSTTAKQFYGLPINECTFTLNSAMLPEYDDQPEWDVKPFAGVFVNDLSHLDFLENGNGINTFEGITNGILAHNCNISSKGSLFKNISDINNSSVTSNLISTSKGHAVFVESSLVTNIEDNDFEDCRLGIFVRNAIYSNLSILNNDFIDNPMNSIVPRGMIHVRNCSNGFITINENETIGTFQGGIGLYFLNELEQLEVIDNEIIRDDSNGHGFIFNNVHPAANKYAFVIGNKVTSKSRSFWITNCSNFSFENNKVNEGNPKSGTGFFISNTTDSHFRDNKLYFDFPGTGFSSNGSSYNLFCCNELYEPNTSFYFTGQSNPSTMTTNTTVFDNETSSSPAWALALRDAQIGPHFNKGNKWTGSWTEAKIFATDDDDNTEIAISSLFRTDFEVTGLKPEFITPMNIENTWWVDLNVTPPTCASVPDCDVPEYEFIPSGPPPGDDCDAFRMHIEALLGPKLAGTFKDQNDWVLYYYAYNHLKDVPEEFWEDCADIYDFMDTVDTEIKIFNETDKRINRAYSLSDTERSTLENTSISILNAKNDIETIFNNLTDIENFIPESIRTLQSDINNAATQVETIVTNVKSNGTNNLINAALTINSITATHDFQDLLLDVWQIKIDILLNGSTKLSQMQIDDLNTIANSCILENGQAAYEARGILGAYFDIDDFVEVEVACAGIKNRSVVDKEELKINIYPNPSTDLFMIELDNESIDVMKMEITNVKGEILMKLKNQQTIDLSAYSSGVYFVHITLSDGMKYHQKLLKVK